MTPQSFIDSVQPVVLVGGRSSRFGRDKLREPIGEGQWLVDRPINALRVVFGLRVALVGECDPEIASRGNLVIPDVLPGVGPIGGIVSALRAHSGPVFVLSGDLPSIDASTISELLDAASKGPATCWAVWAHSGRPEPCIGVYFQSALDSLEDALREERHGLIEAMGPKHRLDVTIDAARAININEQHDLRRAGRP